MQIEYTIKLDYKKLDEHPLGAEEFRLSMEQMSNHLKTTGWLVTNEQTDIDSKMTCRLNPEIFNGLVKQELSKKLSSFRGMIFYNIYNLLGDKLKNQYITNNEKTIKENIYNKITKDVDHELLFFSRIKGFSIMKGNEPLEDVTVQEPIKHKKLKM
jgi:hypothetical protein